MRLHVLNWRINFKYGMAVVPCKFLDPIFIHLILYLYLVLVRYFTVLKTHCWYFNATFTWINSTDNQYFYSLFSALDKLVGFIALTAKHTDDFILGQIRMNIHKNLHLKRKVDAIWLGFKTLVWLAIHQIILTKSTAINMQLLLDIKLTYAGSCKFFGQITDVSLGCVARVFWN